MQSTDLVVLRNLWPKSNLCSKSTRNLSQKNKQEHKLFSYIIYFLFCMKYNLRLKIYAKPVPYMMNSSLCELQAKVFTDGILGED